MNYSKVEIYGQHYTIKSNLDEDEIQALVCYLDKKIHALKSTGVISTSKVAILAALNIAEELFQLRRQKESMESIVAEKSSYLLELIEEGTTT